jgi:arylsulfatase A-like enzyme
MYSGWYYNSRLAENGRWVAYGNSDTSYSTDLLKNKLIGASRRADRSEPLLMVYAPFGVHRQGSSDPIPARRHKGLCANRTWPTAANFNAYDEVSEPPWMAASPAQNPVTMLRWRRAICETLRSIDEGVIAVIHELEAQKRLANTYIVFTSDNGYHLGEHRLNEKGDLYEEAVRVPFLVAGPDVVPGVDERLTSNIDLAPTFLDWARVPAPEGFFDGRSFIASARGYSFDNPDAVLLLGCRTTLHASGGGGKCGGYPAYTGMPWGLRTQRYKYIEYEDGSRQLFDLATDPYELHNLGSNPQYQVLMRAWHERMRALDGPTTFPAPPAPP